MSSLELARITPVNPPIVNKNTKPKDQSMGVSYFKLVPCIVDSQEKILIPVGIAIIIVAAVK
jgi:hypothetical protein